jgi:GR25 family glycosyltransferase involved in LPS biosynthesis
LIRNQTNGINLIYISTDEKSLDFFNPFKEKFHVRFLSDYYSQANLTELNQNHLGMIEQIICANAHTFIGTPRSTFTGYITRMRGYYRDGRYARTFYTLPKEMYKLQTQPNLIGPFWAREFAIAHHDIDDDSVQRRFRNVRNDRIRGRGAPEDKSIGLQIKRLKQEGAIP